jgi:hypothetical protein
MTTSLQGSTNTRETLGRYEVWLWISVMVLVCLLSIRGVGGKLANDSYQYLSMAHNLQSRGEIATSIIEFDTERSRERIPAPATTVAPGYPVAIRAVEWTRIRPESAGLLISLISMAAVVPLLWWGAGMLGATRGMQRAAVLIWVINAQVVEHATSVLSEGLFTLLVVGGVVLLICYEKMGESSRPFVVVMGMALIGLSYFVRYAGLLVMAALITYTAWRVLYRRDRIMLWVSSLTACMGIVACGMIRNTVIAGTWRGGNDLVVHTPASKVLHDTVSIGYHLFFGASRPHLGIALVVSAAAMMAIAVILRKNFAKVAAWPDSVVFLSILLGGYTAGMMYLGMTTMIIFNFSARYFLPILPEVILLGAAVMASVWPLETQVRERRALGVLAAIALCAYAGENVREIHKYDYRPEHLMVAAYYTEPTLEGTSLGAWVEKNIPPESVILATDGQASAYAIHRATISLVSPRMSHGKWDENQVRQTISTFHARYLITYPGISDDSAPEQRESTFLHGLMQGERPSWLVLAAQSPHVTIFEDTENTERQQADGRLIPTDRTSPK